MTAKLSHFAAQFPVEDVAASLEWYCSKLGFTCTFRWGDPVDYGVLKRDDAVSLHLTQRDPDRPPACASIYVFAYDVDAVYRELESREIERLTAPADRDYGMRDFDVWDPDGNRVSFGAEIAT